MQELKQQNTNWAQKLIKRFSAPTMSIGDQAFADYWVMSRASLGLMTESLALRHPAIWRAVNLIAGTVASLPLKSYRTRGDGEREEISSFLDSPQTMGLTRYAWMEMVMFMLLLNGEVGLQKILNGAGRLVQLQPVHPTRYQVKWNGYEKEFTINDTKQVMTAEEFVQIMWLTSDGMRGISPITLFREEFEVASAQQTAAARSSTNGMLVGGLVSLADNAEKDLDEATAQGIMQMLKEKLTGPDQAGGLAFINQRLKVTPWTANAKDMQFLESREFGITEVARMYGIPVHMLGQIEKQTSFGAGLQEQNRNFQQFTLLPWTTRLEETFSTLLPSPQHAEFDYHGLLQGTPSEEINSLIGQVNTIRTLNEVRSILNLPPLPGGDVMQAPAPVSPEAKPRQDVQQKMSEPLPAKQFRKTITKIKKGSDGSLTTTTEEAA